MNRYLGYEPATSHSQVITYLEQNYAGDDGMLMPHEIAVQIAAAGREQIAKGIQVFRSNVYYLGDEAVKNHGGGLWHELPEDDEDEYDDNDLEGV